MQRMPLFPLGTVLFPGLMLPLTIFEPRYVALLRHLESEPQDRPRQFGVVAIRTGHEVGEDGVHALHDVGCIATVRSVRELPQDRFAVSTVGVQRFRLHDLDAGAHTPWTTGVVTPMQDVDGEDAPASAHVVAARFSQYLHRLGRSDPEGGHALQDDPRLLSYLVAAAMILTADDRQRLLAADSTAQRLSEELDLLRREASAYAVVPSVPAVDLSRADVTTN